MDACDTLDFLDAVPAVLMECIARAVPVRFGVCNVRGRDQPRNWTQPVGKRGCLSDLAGVGARQARTTLNMSTSHLV